MLARVQAKIADIKARNRETWHAMRALDLSSTQLTPANDDAELDALLATLDEAAPADVEPAPGTGAIDAELDALLADLPFDLAHRPAPVVTDLDGNPVEEPTAPLSIPMQAPGLKQETVTRQRPARARKSQARDLENRVARMAYRRSRVTSATSPLAAPLAQNPSSTPSNLNTPSDLPDPSDPNAPTDLNPSTSPTQAKTPNALAKTKGRKSRARLMASWDEAGELTKLDYVNRAGAHQGDAFAWTLNLAPDVEKAANDNGRPLDHLWRRVNSCLAREPALASASVPLWLVLETTPAGRLHIHGGLFVANPELLPAIERALAKAGGEWGATAGREHQLDVGPQRTPDAWAAYPLWRQGQTRRHLREAAGLEPDAPVRIATWSRGLTADAKRLHAEERRAIGRR